MKKSLHCSQNTTEKSSSPRQQEFVLSPMSCCVCGKKVEGFYGRTQNGGYCSKSCGVNYEKKMQQMSQTRGDE